MVDDLEAPWPALGYSERSGIDSDGDATIDQTSASLSVAAYIVKRVDGIKTLVKHLVSGEYLEWDLFLNIAGRTHSLCREADVPSLLEAYEISLLFADAATAAMCLDKGRTWVGRTRNWMTFECRPTRTLNNRGCSCTLASGPRLLQSFQKIRVVVGFARARLNTACYRMLASRCRDEGLLVVCKASSVYVQGHSIIQEDQEARGPNKNSQ